MSPKMDIRDFNFFLNNNDLDIGKQKETHLYYKIFRKIDDHDNKIFFCGLV